MILFLSYLLKIGACIVAFYLAYMAILSKETFFKLSRFVLLLSVIFSIVLPIWTITITKEIITTQVVQQNMEASTFTDQMLINPDSNINNWTDIFPIIALGVYILGTLIFFTRNIFGILQIYRIMMHSRREVTADVKLFIVRKAIIPFSWFHNIIISEEDYAKNRDIIIEHEKAHMKFKHGYDLLFINLIAIFQWFNPVIWLLRKELISIHEYQADNRVINKGIDAKKYQYLLISKGTAQCISIPVVNHLCSGNFKQRIKMMLKKRSNSQNAIKALLMIPLVASAVIVFAKTEYVEATAYKKDFYAGSNVSALAQNLQKQDGFVYFVDGKEVSVEVIKTMSILDLVSYKIYKREEAVTKFGQKAINGAVDIITRASSSAGKSTQEHFTQPKDTKVYSDQILMITIKSDGSYVLGKWIDKKNKINLVTATKSDIENVINGIIPRMKYTKDSVIVSIKFENQVSLLERFEKLSLLEDVLKNSGIKNISVQISESNSKTYQKNILAIKINDVGVFWVNNEIVNDNNKLESVIKSQIEKLKSISKETKITVTVQASSNTPNEVIEKLMAILKEEKITKINYATKQSSKIDLFSKTSESSIVRFVAANVIYPQEAKNSCDTGKFYITVKIDKGQLIESKLHTTKAGIEVPLLSEIIIVAYKSNANESPVVKVDNEHIALKNESIRIANKLTELQIPEWKDKCVEFALPLNFLIR